MSPETAAKLKLGFSTIISNDSCVRAGREFHWYSAVILAVLSVIIALVPNLVSGLRVDAGNTILGTSYGLETGLAVFLNDLKGSNADIAIDNESIATATNWESIANDPTHKWYQHTSTATGEVTFEAYYNYYGAALTDYDFLYNRILKGLTPDGTARDASSSSSSASVSSDASTVSSSSLPVEALPYHTNCVLFGRQFFYLVTFATNSTAANVAGGQYDRLHGVSIKSLASADLSGKAYANTFESNPLGYAAEVRETFKNFARLGYETTKVSRAWNTVGIMFGVFAGMEILLGLVIFLITRGKRNPYRIFTFWQTQKMAYWAAPTPAIISLVLGFILANAIGQFAFIMVFGIRIVWLSMRSLSPAREQ